MSATVPHQHKTLEDDSNRKGSKTRNFIDANLKKHKGNVRPLTADVFLDIWRHYDRDASRYLEESETKTFLRDFLNSALVGPGSAKNVTATEADQLYDVFMEEFDDNKDGKISIREVQESFFALFRNNTPPETGIDYMKVWTKYDKDGSGYIEVDELKNFLRDLIARAKVQPKISESNLTDYATDIMNLFDTNNDGKLGFQELIRLLPAKENFVKLTLENVHLAGTLNQSTIDDLLSRYDKDKNGTLEGTELSNLVIDILQDHAALTGEEYNAKDVYEVEQALLKGCDVDGNGKIDRKELAIVLLAISRAGVDVISISDVYTPRESLQIESVL